MVPSLADGWLSSSWMAEGDDGDIKPGIPQQKPVGALFFIQYWTSHRFMYAHAHAHTYACMHAVRIITGHHIPGRPLPAEYAAVAAPQPNAPAPAIRRTGPLTERTGPCPGVRCLNRLHAAVLDYAF